MFSDSTNYVFIDDHSSPSSVVESIEKIQFTVVLLKDIVNIFGFLKASVAVFYNCNGNGKATFPTSIENYIIAQVYLFRRGTLSST